MATLQGPHFHTTESARTNGDGLAVLERAGHQPQDRLAVLEQVLGESACRQIGIYPVPTTFKLSVVIPVYNEKRWIREIVRRVEAAPFT